MKEQESLILGLSLNLMGWESDDMSTPNVTIIDYGVGNLLSVQRGFEYFGVSVELSSDPEKILSAKRVVLPGVGAFPKAIQALKSQNLDTVIQELSNKGTPLLAICLGMQLLLEGSDEFGQTAGLSLISGRVVAVPNKTIEGTIHKIPNVGWSSLNVSSPRSSWENTLLQDNKPGDAAYFVHSFMSQPSNQKNQIAYINYGGHKVSAVISREKITGCQFHPEKSGIVGLKILRRFILQ
jgi:glutamine amidotransferase